MILKRHQTRNGENKLGKVLCKVNIQYFQHPEELSQFDSAKFSRY